MQYFISTKQMSTRKRTLEDGDNEHQSKRQKTGHNGVSFLHPFDVPELVERIVSHLLSSSPLSILNIICSSKHLRDVISVKSLWRSQGFKQLYDTIADDTVPLEYLRAVLGQLELDKLKEEQLHWGKEANFLATNLEIKDPEILQCKFDLVPKERKRYDPRRLRAIEYLADRYITEDAHRVLLNLMARMINKLFSLQQLIEFIEISESEILQKQKQNLFDYVPVPASEYSEIDASGFNEHMRARVNYYSQVDTGPAKFYQLLGVQSDVYTTVLHREDDFQGSLVSLNIWKRFIDNDRSILVFDGSSEIASHTFPAQTAFIRFNSKENLIEECGFIDVQPNDETDLDVEASEDIDFLNFIEYPSKKHEHVATLAAEIETQLFGNWEQRYIVTRIPPPEKYFKNVKFRRTQSDLIGVETNLCKVHHKSKPANIVFESILPYLVNYPKSLLAFSAVCKDFRGLIRQRDCWKRLGFVHFAEWFYEYEQADPGMNNIKRMLRAVRNEYVREKITQLNAKIERVTQMSKLSPQVIEEIQNKLFGSTEDIYCPNFWVQEHCVRYQEYLANTKIADDILRMLMWLKRKIAIDVLSLEDLLRFIELDKSQLPDYHASECITKVILPMKQKTEKKEKDDYLICTEQGAWREEDWDYIELMKVKHAYSPLYEPRIDYDEVRARLKVCKIFINDHRSVLLIQSYTMLHHLGDEEQFVIKYDKSKNLIEEFATLSTLRVLPEDFDQQYLICKVLERPNGPIGELLYPVSHWGDPYEDFHLKNVELKK